MIENEFPEFETTPVVNSTLMADSIFSVQVTYTANLNDSAIRSIENALVLIENEGMATDTLFYSEKGWYIGNNAVKAGEFYTCKVIVPNMDTVWAQTYVPMPVPIYGLLFTEVAGMDEEGDLTSSFRFLIDQDSSSVLYWEVRMISMGYFWQIDYKTGEWSEQYGANKQFIFMVPGQDRVLLNEASPLTLFSNKEMGSSQYEVKFYTDRISKIPSEENYFIELRSVSESYYRYHKQLYLYQTAQFVQLGSSPQTYPLYSNVNNGRGIFSALSISRTKIEIAP
jgi:hypothetical protein